MRVTVRMGEHLWRPLTGSDQDTRFVIAMRNNPRFAGMFYQSAPVTPESHRNFIRLAEQRSEINWLIERAGAALGLSSIYNIDLDNRKCECGRVAMLEGRLFFASWLVNGFVTFDTMGLNRAYIETLEQNRVIAHGVERMGMVREGVLRGHVFREGKPLNVALYSILASEWQARREAHFARWGTPELVSFEGRKVTT